MDLRPCVGTLCGAVVGVLTFIVWLVTSEPDGGMELARYLFPVSSFVLERAHPGRPVPVFLWYGAALVPWVVLGAMVDLMRASVRGRATPAGSR